MLPDLPGSSPRDQSSTRSLLLLTYSAIFSHFLSLCDISFPFVDISFPAISFSSVTPSCGTAETHPQDVFLAGYSDAILRFVAERGEGMGLVSTVGLRCNPDVILLTTTLAC